MLKEKNFDVSGLEGDRAEKVLGYAIEARKSEIDRLWSRSLVFWGLVAASLVAYATLFKDARYTAPEFAMACFGLVCSLAWTLQNRGSKYWQEAWENKVALLESKALDINLFGNREPLQRKGFWGAGRWSVSKLIIAVSDLTVLVWVGLLLVSWPVNLSWLSAVSHSAVPLRFWALLATGIYSILILFFGRTGR